LTTFIRLATVPPENSPRITLTRILTRVQGAPSRFIAWRCRKCTPMSEGMESNPQQCTMRAPDFRAVAS
jgi:hypothetical protein